MRNLFIGNQISGDKNLKKLEGWNKGILTNFKDNLKNNIKQKIYRFLEVWYENLT